MRSRFLLPFLLLALLFAPTVKAVTLRWSPATDLTWQVQFTGSVDLSVSADVFDLDMVETPARTVRRIHDRGRHAVCYIDAGAWENWRPDADAYPQIVKGRPLDGWPGERWLDIRRIDVLGPILADRIELCRAKGFDGVEFDNVDGQSNQTGFDLSADDQLHFNRWLAHAAHDMGLAAGLKNALEIAHELEPDFDFGIVEQCFEYRECSLTAPFVDAGKPVLDVEYSLPRGQFCERAAELGIFAMRKHLDLDAWRRAC